MHITVSTAMDSGQHPAETLKVSQIAYNADIVIYKLDDGGWEVELCDLRL